MNSQAPLDPALLKLFLNGLRTSDKPAEALFLTFNSDLPFFESRLLSSMRAANALVTVIADSRVWRPDQHAIAAAGRGYHVGLVGARRAFHPKLSLVVSEKSALAVVGSGNLSLPGWSLNAELSTVLTGTEESAPRAFDDIRAALTTLASSGVVDDFSTAGIRRAIDKLTTYLRSTPVDEEGPRVVASWDGPLIDQLPLVPVAELLLSAPFLGSDSSAIRVLLDRLKPGLVRIALQEGSTVFDANSLSSVLADFESAADIRVESITDGRYHHGKLVEWVVDGQRWTLTGSANLSRAALLEAAPQGNYELGVISRANSTLFPAGRVVDLSQITPAPRVESSSTEVLPASSAIIRSGRLDVTVGERSVAVEVEVATPPNLDVWVVLATIPAGQATAKLPACAPGARIRLVMVGPDGSRRHSAVSFVSDPDRVLDHSHRRAGTPLWDELVSDSHLMAVLRGLAGEVVDDDTAWLDTSEEDADTADIEEAPVLEDQSSGPEPEPVPAPDLEPDPTLEARRRDMCTALTARSTLPSTSLSEMLQALIVTLWCWRIGTWDKDAEPLKLIATQLDAVLDTEAGTPRWARRRATLLAIGLALTATHVNEKSTDPATLAFRARLRRAGAHWAEVDQELTESFAQAIARPSTDRLKEEVAMFTNPSNDELSRALNAVIGDRDYAVERVGPWSAVVRGDLSKRRVLSLPWEVVGTAEDLEKVCVWAVDEEGSWALAVWSAPNLLVIQDQANKSQRWMLHEFTNPSRLGPKAVYESHFTRQDPLPQHHKRIVPPGEPTQRMLEALAAGGLETPEPPDMTSTGS